MTLTFSKIASLSEVSFDQLFDDSLVHLETNFLWPVDMVTPEYRKTSYQERLMAAINGDMALAASPTSTFLMFKVSEDTKDLMLNAGFVDDTGAFKSHWYLTSPDSTDSRNWIYTQEMDDARSSFFAENGVSAFKVATFIDSPLYRLIKSRNAAGRNVIIDESPTVGGANPQNLVTVTMQV